MCESNLTADVIANYFSLYFIDFAANEICDEDFIALFAQSFRINSALILTLKILKCFAEVKEFTCFRYLCMA